jgi:hypothetical protein
MLALEGCPPPQRRYDDEHKDAEAFVDAYLMKDVEERKMLGGFIVSSFFLFFVITFCISGICSFHSALHVL